MRVLIFGDSITQGFWDTEGGWVARLRKAYDLKAVETGDYDQPTIFNLGVSGDSSDNILNRFDAETQARASEELSFVIAVGVNDSRTKAGAIYSTIEQYEQNLSDILVKAQKQSNKILFVGLTPCIEARSNPVSWGNTGYTNERIEEFNVALRNFCKESQVSFVEILEPFKNAGDEDELLPDSLHPSNKGHQLMADLIGRGLQELLHEN